MFSASTFIYNNIPSEFYGVYIGYSGKDSKAGAGESEEAASGDVSLLTQKIFRRPQPLMYGVEQSVPFTFYLSMYAPNGGWDEGEYSKISNWLHGQQDYGILRMCQNDLLDVYFRCIFIKPQTNRYGNFIRAMNTYAQCDAPWGWKSPLTNNYSWANNYNVNENINFYNDTDNNYYTFPNPLIITASTFGGNITVTNTTDNGRQFILNALPNEVFTIDCYNQTIESNLNPLPLENFNLNWLRFLKGLNKLNISGNILSMEMTTERAVMVGG